MDKLILKMDEVLPSDIGVIEGAVTKITHLILEKGCAESLDRIDLALRKVLANAIIHGNRSSRDKFVRICVVMQEDRRVLSIVKDAGSGFDPTQIPSPVVGQNLHSGHGRGIFLISMLMDDVGFSFDAGTNTYMRWNPPSKGS